MSFARAVKNFNTFIFWSHVSYARGCVGICAIYEKLGRKKLTNNITQIFQVAKGIMFESLGEYFIDLGATCSYGNIITNHADQFDWIIVFTIFVVFTILVYRMIDIIETPIGLLATFP